MTTTFNRLWLAFIVPAILIAAIGATVALAQDDGDSATDRGAGSVLLQEDPTPTPDAEETPPSDDGSEDDGSEDDGSEDEGKAPGEGCDHGESGDSDGESEGAGSTTGLSFRRR